MAPQAGTPAPSPRPRLLALCAALPLLLLLCGLCAFCKNRRKRRVRNVCAGGVALVDVTLLRQTQLRSLSKSDTKLHEIKRPPPADPQLRPVSLDPLYHAPSWPHPGTAEDNATYSNLNYTPATPKNELSERAARQGKPASDPRGEPQGDEVTAEYAVVRKGKKGANMGVREHKKEESAQSPLELPGLPHRPDHLEIEAMYSKVHKKKKKKNVVPGEENADGSANMAAERAPSPPPAPAHPEENLYESIYEISM